ncbi:MFS transporter [Naumannella halotolerans]|uniref:MFS transporter n=1 Tax=Naumannella halotolerans TaxID=993414 RepID=UPI00370D6927
MVTTVGIRSRFAVPLYVGGAALSLFGNSAIAIVLPWLVLARTGDVTITATVATVSGIATVPATVLGGRLADRFGARRVAVLADIGSAVSVAALPVVDAVWGLDLMWFVILGAVGALFDVPGMTARQALMAEVAETSGTKVDTVAGVFQASFSLAFLAGPALAGLLLGWFDPVTVVWVTAMCSALAGVLTWLLPVSPSIGADHQATGRGGWQLIIGDRRLLAVLFISFAATLITPPLLAVVLPAFYAGIERPELLGFTLSAFAVGSLLGAVLYALLSKRSRLPAYLAAMGMMTLGMVAVALLASVPLIMVGMLLLGLGGGLFGPVWNVFIAEQLPTGTRGRVLGWFTAATMVAGPIGLGGLTLALTLTDMQTAALALGIFWVFVAVLAVISRDARAVATAPAPEPRGADGDAAAPVADDGGADGHHEAHGSQS